MSACGCGRKTSGTGVCTICKGTIERGFCGTDFKDLVKREDGNWECAECHQIYYAEIHAKKDVIPAQAGIHVKSNVKLDARLQSSGMTDKRQTQKSEEKINKMAVYPKPKCKRGDCDKQVVMDGECSHHFRETHGITVVEARKQRAGSRKPEAGRARDTFAVADSRHDSGDIIDFALYLRGLVRQEVRSVLKEMFNGN